MTRKLHTPFTQNTNKQGEHDGARGKGTVVGGSVKRSMDNLMNSVPNKAATPPLVRPAMSATNDFFEAILH